MLNSRTTWLPAVASLALVACGSGSGSGSGSGAGPATPPTTTTTTVTPVVPVSTAASPWVQVGPAPPAIEAPVAVHRSSGTIYVASLGGGVLKSSDLGATFKAVNTGLGSLVTPSMAMAPNDPNTVYVGTFNGGIYKTTDGGANWAVTGEKTNITLTLAVDPTNANIVYAGYQGTPAIRKSTDGGATWSTASAGIPNTGVFALVVDPTNPRTLYAGTTGTGAWQSTDSGATWRALSIDTSVYSFFVDPTNGANVYAGGNGTGVWISRDRGVSFQKLSTPGDGVVMALGKYGPRLYAGTASTGLWISSDDGQTWSASSINGGLVLSLALDDNGGAYVGTARRGALRADPAASTFQPIAGALLQACRCQNIYGVSIDPSDSKHVMLATNDGGMIETRDSGATWGDAGDRGLTARAPRQATFDPQDPKRIYAGSFTGMGFFRSTDGGKTWGRREFGGTALHTTGVAVDPADRAVYVATLQAGGVWKSSDLGETFTRVDVQTAGGAFVNLNGRGIAVDPGRPGVVFHAGGTGVWRSTNSGATWTRVSTTSALSVTVDPTNPQVVYVGTSAAGVLKSLDGGTTFAAANVGLTDLRTGRTGGVVLHRSAPNVLYVNTEGGGVFRSTDGGGSWSAVNTGLTELTVFALAIDPADPKTLWAGTVAGVFKTTSGAL